MDVCACVWLNTSNDYVSLLAKSYAQALHIARALNYLHSSIPMVIHRDLKAANILLTRECGSLAVVPDKDIYCFGRRRYSRIATRRMNRWMYE